MTGALGRRVPTDDEHIRKYGLRTLLPVTVETVEDVLPLPPHRRFYDQGEEGACVGFAASWLMSILNVGDGPVKWPKYDARWLYQAAQQVDEWAETPPEEGTSVRAAMDVLRLTGHRQIVRGETGPPEPELGILENRWATSVDEVRTAIAAGAPVALGVNWYSTFDTPVLKRRDWWIGEVWSNLGVLRGGHAVCVYGASDRREAVKIVNNWGMAYPLVWMPYRTLERLLQEWGEATLVTDRRGA